MLELRGGKLRCQRFGGASWVRQDDNPRAPEKYGLWAFPWPYFDWYFCYHRWELVLPKRLRAECSFFPNLANTFSELDDEQRNALWDQRRQWINDNCRQLRINEFWAHGPIYTHLNLRGMASAPDNQEWNLMTPQQFAKACRVYYAHENGRDQLQRYVDAGPMEIFVPRGSARL